MHNAGVAELGTLSETSVDMWRKTFEANVVAVAELTGCCCPPCGPRTGTWY